MDEGDIISATIYQRHIENDLEFEGKSVRELVSVHKLERVVSEFLAKETRDSQKIMKLNDLGVFLYENGFFFKAIEISKTELSFIKDNISLQEHCLMRISRSYGMVGDEKESRAHYEKAQDISNNQLQKPSNEKIDLFFGL